MNLYEFDFEAKLQALLKHKMQAESKGIKVKGGELADKLAAILKAPETPVQSTVIEE